uniref:Integrase catalytic domain-containing protein n=1 Tax=Meloidogyne enterolobii TaxID=390850 RepID=A0A6V7X636_MELEN|nr:unnamed protein product [Meloidogyne enterolobii]
MGKTLDTFLEKIYYSLNSPASYAGINRVYIEARRKYPKIKLKDVYDFLHRQRVYTMHRPLRKKFPRTATRPSGLHTDWQADLAIFDQLAKYNDGYKYLLVCIDVLSRKIFAVPAKSKSSEDMIEAFENIFKLSKGILPHKLYTDRGLEFEAKRMKEYFKKKDIDKRVVYSPDVHASMAERANRTIKERLYRYFSEQNTLRWNKVIQKIVSGINASINRTTGVTPNSVTFKNAGELFNRLYKDPKNIQILKQAQYWIQDKLFESQRKR